MSRGGGRETVLRVGAVFFIAGLWLFGAAGAAAAFFAFSVDGRVVDQPDALHPLDGGVGVALPVLEEHLGFVVDGSGPPVVELRFGGRTALLVVGDGQAVVDGKPRTLDATPRRHGETVYVPLTLVAELARLRIDFDLGAGALRLVGGGGLMTGGTGAAAGEEAPPSRTAAAEQDGAPTDAPTVPGPTDAVPPPVTGGPKAPGDEPTVPAEAPSAPTDGATHPAEGATFATVHDVRVVEREGRVHIEVAADGDVAPRVMFLDGPARLVVDVEGAAVAGERRVVDGDGRIVERVRWSETDGGIRFVADLTAPTGYALGPRVGGSGFTLTLSHPFRLSDASPRDGGVVLRMETTGAVPYRVFRLGDPERLVVDFFGVTVPGPQEVPLSVGWATAFRLSQYEHDAVRGVFVLDGGAEAPPFVQEGVLQPDSEGGLHLLFHPDRVLATAGPAAVDGDEAFVPGRGAPAEEKQTAADGGGGAVDAPADAANDANAANASNGLAFVGYGRLGDLEYVVVEAERPLEIDVQRLGSPDRIVLHLPGVSVGHSRGLAPEGSGVVTAVRAGQAEDAAGRIVAETRGVAEHHLALSPDGTRAVLGLRPSGLAGRTIVVDPGHGGKDPGAIGHSGAFEKDVTLAIALQTALLLQRAGADVVLTRDRDVELSLAERAQRANLIGADAFVSIHADAIGFGRVASGTSTFYHPENGSNPEGSLHRRYALALQGELLEALGLPDRGVHERRFHVVFNTTMPSALVEVGFIDNPEEEKLLLDPAFQARAAAAVAEGIRRFFAEEADHSPEQSRQWRARVEATAGTWLRLGEVPPDVRPLEATPLAAVAQLESPAGSDGDGDGAPATSRPEM